MFHHNRLAFLAAITLAWPAMLQSAPAPPDIQIESRDHEQITSLGQPILRFSTWTKNLGAKALELHCDTQGSSSDVYQWVFDTNGGHTVTFVGTFVVDSQGRVRFNDSADYFLREKNEDNSVGGIVGSREKVAYCLVDSFPVPSPTPPGTPPNSVYTNCGATMGISRGWIDNYGRTLSSQNIVLTGITTGTYWLENIADPGNRLVESDDSNNYHKTLVSVTTTFVPEINLVGNGQSIPNNDTTPGADDHTDFGYVDVASGAVTRTFTIQNTGTGTLSLTGVPKVKINGSGDFAVAVHPVSPVVNGASTTLQVAFNPSSPGAKGATVQIINNDGNESLYEFAIRGNTDGDNDGLPDGWETQHNVTDPDADTDGDGMSNGDEFVAGTLPRDANSVFKIKSVQCDASGCEVFFDSITGRVYRVEYRDNFTDAWMLVEQKTGTGSPLSVSDGSAAGEATRFYQLTVGF